MEQTNGKTKPKRIPYGMMNFGHLRRDNCYYVDKTRFIERIEEANKYFFFIRPRRFGKSLTLLMLAHYYDIRLKDRFDELAYLLSNYHDNQLSYDEYELREKEEAGDHLLRCVDMVVCEEV